MLSPRGETARLISEAWALSAVISMHAHRHTHTQVGTFIQKHTHGPRTLSTKLIPEMWAIVRSHHLNVQSRPTYYTGWHPHRWRKDGDTQTVGGRGGIVD